MEKMALSNHSQHRDTAIAFVQAPSKSMEHAELHVEAKVGRG